MRRICLFLAAIFTLFLSTTGHAMLEWGVFGTTTLTRGTGEPITETFIFSALGGQAILKLTNGNLEDSSVELVSSSVVTFKGQVLFGPSEFNQNVNYVESEVPLVDGQNTLKALLKGKPGGQVTLQIIQGVAEITPEIVLVRTANCLRAEDIEGALQGFEPNEKSQIIPTLDAAQRNMLANYLENAELTEETANTRSYRYS